MRLLVSTVVAALVSFSAPAAAEDTIKVGVVVELSLIHI